MDAITLSGLAGAVLAAAKTIYEDLNGAKKKPKPC